MNDGLEYFSWSPTREIFVQTMTDLVNPVTGQPLASVEDDVLIPSEHVRIDEIGPIVKTPATYDEEGNELTAAIMVEGHHVNLWAVGELADLLRVRNNNVDYATINSALPKENKKKISYGN